MSLRLQVYKTVFFKTIHLENYYNGLHFSLGLIRFMIGLDCNQWEMTNFKFGNFDFFSEPTEKCLKDMQKNDAN